MRQGQAKESGFTLVELMIVIAIIAILASIAIPQYLKYQRKSKVSSYAMPIVRACLMDVSAYCVENPGSNFTNPVGDSKFANCKDSNVTTAGGTVTMNKEQDFTCDNTGALTAGAINGTISGVTDYKAVCTITSSGSFKCSVESY